MSACQSQHEAAHGGYCRDTAGHAGAHWAFYREGAGYKFHWPQTEAESRRKLTAAERAMTDVTAALDAWPETPNPDVYALLRDLNRIVGRYTVERGDE